MPSHFKCHTSLGLVLLPPSVLHTRTHTPTHTPHTHTHKHTPHTHTWITSSRYFRTRTWKNRRSIMCTHNLNWQSAVDTKGGYQRFMYFGQFGDVPPTQLLSINKFQLRTMHSVEARHEDRKPHPPSTFAEFEKAYYWFFCWFATYFESRDEIASCSRPRNTITPANEEKLCVSKNFKGYNLNLRAALDHWKLLVQKKLPYHCYSQPKASVSCSSLHFLTTSEWCCIVQFPITSPTN